MRVPLTASMLGLLIVTACALALPREQQYLRSAQGHATQEDIRRELGPPVLVDSRIGETIWVYQTRTAQTGSRSMASGIWCEEYVLVFDDRGVLRRWSHQSEFHGGEMMPIYCVTGGYRAAS